MRSWTAELEPRDERGNGATLDEHLVGGVTRRKGSDTSGPRRVDRKNSKTVQVARKIRRRSKYYVPVCCSSSLYCMIAKWLSDDRMATAL